MNIETVEIADHSPKHPTIVREIERRIIAHAPPQLRLSGNDAEYRVIVPNNGVRPTHGDFVYDQTRRQLIDFIEEKVLLFLNLDYSLPWREVDAHIASTAKKVFQAFGNELKYVEYFEFPSNVLEEGNVHDPGEGCSVRNYDKIIGGGYIHVPTSLSVDEEDLLQFFLVHVENFRAQCKALRMRKVIRYSYGTKLTNYYSWEGGKYIEGNAETGYHTGYNDFID